MENNSINVSEEKFDCLRRAIVAGLRYCSILDNAKYIPDKAETTDLAEVYKRYPELHWTDTVYPGDKQPILMVFTPAIPRHTDSTWRSPNQEIAHCVFMNDAYLAAEIKGKFLGAVVGWEALRLRKLKEAFEFFTTPVIGGKVTPNS